MHRLAAAKTLQWESIWATVLEGLNADRAALAEIDENLARADLSPAERAAHQYARKELYERLHPQTRKGSAGGRAKSANPRVLRIKLILGTPPTSMMPQRRAAGPELAFRARPTAASQFQMSPISPARRSTRGPNSTHSGGCRQTSESSSPLRQKPARRSLPKRP